MADTAIGTAKMSLTLDTAEYSVAIDRAKQKQAGLGEAAAQEASKMTRAQRQVVASLDNQIAKLGLTREQMLQYNVITRTTGETQAALLNRIKANTVEIEKQGRAATKSGVELNKYGISAKQTAAALRGVPAQMTDIVVSLQGGQNPLTVLLQQGGQLKDMFGGVVPAARALGGAVMGLVNPFTVTAAVIGVVGAAYLSAESRQNAFNQALILTGQQGLTTADQLNEMALRLDNISGVTSRQAAAALTQIVANGRLAASQYELVTQAAVMMEDAVGKAVSETVSEYADLARDPVNAVLRLNETERFLTQSVYERIRAMSEAGDIEGAAALATETRAASQIERAREVVDSLGLVSGAWHSIKENTGEAWDEAVNYFGTLDKEAKEAAGTLKNLWDSMRSGITSPWSMQNALYGQSGPVGGSSATSAGANDPVVNSAVQKQLDAMIAGNRSREERQKLEETQIVNLYRQLGISKEDKRVQDALLASQARYKESLPKGKDGTAAARALESANSQAALQAIKNQEDAERSAIQNTSRVLQAQYSARLVTATDFYAKQRELITRDSNAQETALQQQIEYLGQRNVAGKDSVTVTRQMGELESKLAKVRADTATQLVVLGIQEQEVADKRKAAVTAYTDALDNSLSAARASADAQLAAIMLGQREADLQQRIAAVRDEAANKQRQLAREFAESNDEEVYRSKLNALRDYTEEQVRIVQDGYARMEEAQSDWRNGMRSGLQDWIAGAQDVAGQTSAMLGESLDATVDALTNFAMTSKLQWRDLLRDIGTEITKFLMKQAVLQFAQMFAGMFGGTATNVNSINMAGGYGGGTVYAAKGDVFNGAAGLSQHSGTVVNKPTPFFFASGGAVPNRGVMGEAGYEGIFPLQRGSDGKLGVKAMGAGGATNQVQITTQITIADGQTNSNTQTAGAQAALWKEVGAAISSGAQREIQRALMPNGLIWNAGVK